MCFTTESLVIMAAIVPLDVDHLPATTKTMRTTTTNITTTTRTTCSPWIFPSCHHISPFLRLFVPNLFLPRQARLKWPSWVAVAARKGVAVVVKVMIVLSVRGGGCGGIGGGCGVSSGGSSGSSESLQCTKNASRSSGSRSRWIVLIEMVASKC